MLFATAAVGRGCAETHVLMLFQTVDAVCCAAVGCGCAEPHVLMLFWTVDAVCCCRGWPWVCGTPCIDVVSV
jgi:hypothetical protein